MKGKTANQKPRLDTEECKKNKYIYILIIIISHEAQLWQRVSAAEQKQLLMSRRSGQSQSTLCLRRHLHGDSRKERSHWSVLTSCEKGLKVTEHGNAPLVISHNASPRVGGP